MATKSPLALAEIPGESSAMTEARQSYLDTQKKLLEALESRNQLFDPTLLAMAQGFLAPTKSGSFGESISNVAASVGPVAEAERKRDIEMAQIRAELAAGQYGAAQKGEALKKLTGAMRPSAAADTAGAATGSANQFAGITPEIALQIAMFDPELGKQAFQYLEAQAKGIVTQPSGQVDVRSGKFTPFPGQAPTERTIPGVGTLKVSLEDAIRIDKALQDNDAESLYRVVDKYTKEMPRPGAATPGVPSAPSAPSAPRAPAPTAPPVAVTVEERERQKRAEESRAAVERREQEELVTGGAKRTGAAIDAGGIATAKQQTAKEIQQLIGTEGMNQYFGAFNKPNDIFSAIVLSVARASESGSQGVDRSQIERVVSNLTLNLPKNPNETMEQFKQRKQQVVDRASMAASRIAEMELYYSQLIKGQGQITEGEREILRRAAINPRFDTPNVIMAKAKAIEAIANFEKWRADTLEERGITLAKLKQDPEYKRMEQARIRAVNDALKPLLPKGQQPARSGGLSMDAINQRAESLGIKP